MMSDIQRAKFSLIDGRVEIEGSEAFVTAQLIRLEPLLAKMFEPPRAAGSAPEPVAAAAHHAPAPITSAGVGLDKYLHLYAAADGKLKILKSLPGDGKAGKTISAALLLTYGNEINGGKSTTMDQIRMVCTEHACLDSGNFAAAFKKPVPRGYFTLSGPGSNQTIALTHPGRLKAVELAAALNK
jgi:hypothetical protein